jgi:hypothetical protein
MASLARLAPPLLRARRFARPAPRSERYPDAERALCFPLACRRGRRRIRHLTERRMGGLLPSPTYDAGRPDHVQPKQLPEYDVRRQARDEAYADRERNRVSCVLREIRTHT